MHPNASYAPAPPLAPAHAVPPAQPGAAPPPDRALAATGLVVRYGDVRQSQPALRGVDVSIAPGEHVAVMGPSGSGKTTLVHALAGIVRPTSGQVWWRGADLARAGDAERTRLRRTDFGFVFQSGHLLPELPAIENVALPLLVGGVARGRALAAAAHLLQPLGLADLGHRRPGELSGGQTQRVAIARALVTDPAVVFADEPTGALDSDTGAEVMRLLTGATRAVGAALVVVTHDDGVAAWCGRTIRLRDGLVVSGAGR